MEQADKNLRPRGAIGIYILNDKNQLLLLLRNSKHQNNKWCPPGGHIEYGEDFLDTAKRETQEESGISVEKIKILGVTSNVYREERVHYITTHVLAEKYSGQASMTEPDKFTDIGWFGLNNLPENLFPANKDFLDNNPLCLCGSDKKFKECHGK